MIKATCFILIGLLITLAGCNNGNKNSTLSTRKSSASIIDSLHADTFKLKESFKEDDTAFNEYLAEKLKPIRTNFKRINSIVKWDSVIQKDLWESTEGGEANYFYLNAILEKITARYYGEMGQSLIEYYLLDNHLSFVFEKSYKYNRPIYYDSSLMKENNDNQTFNLDSSEIIEVRSYFEKEKLIHQISNQDCGAPFSDGYLLSEQKRLNADFDKLKR